MLNFNEERQLVNFVSEDRISVDEMKTYPFSTPVGNYQNRLMLNENAEILTNLFFSLLRQNSKALP